MTQEDADFAGYLQFLYIEDNGVDARINNSEEYAFKLPQGWRNEDDIENALYSACYNFNLDYIAEDTVKRTVREALQSFKQRRRGSQKHDDSNTASATEKKNEESSNEEDDGFWHPHDVARDLMEKYHFLTFEDTHEILVYSSQSGCYERYGAEFIMNQCRNYMLKKVNMRTGKITEVELDKPDDNEVIYYIQTTTGIKRDLLKGAVDGEWIHAKNLWVNIKTKETEPHSPDRLSTATIGASYNPRARANEFIKVIKAALTTKDEWGNKDCDQVIKLIKNMGNILVEDQRYEAMVLFIGGGGNRKGTILAVLGATVGRDSTSNVSLQQLGKDKFMPAQLYGKTLNVYADLDKSALTNTGIIKMLVSGDPMEVQKKGQHPFTLFNKSKQWYSTNEIPESPDQTDAWFRRLQIFVFPHKFPTDKTLYARLTTEEEKSGILNMMIRGRALLEEEGFDEVDLFEVKRLYNTSAGVNKNSVQEWLDTQCILVDGVKVLSADAQKNYTEWCIKEGKIPENETVFGRALKDNGILHRRTQGQILTTNGRKSTVRGYFYIGMTFRDPSQNSLTSRDPTNTLV